jgi:hypothetical protein
LCAAGFVYTYERLLVMVDDEKIQMGGAEECSTAPATHDQDGAGFAEGEGSGGGQHVGTVGAGSPWGVAFFLGGIVAQLIQDAADRRAEVVDCIDWYQRELEKCDRRLESLNALAQSIQSQE